MGIGRSTAVIGAYAEPKAGSIAYSAVALTLPGVASGVLLALAFRVGPLAPLVFVALVPLLVARSRHSLAQMLCIGWMAGAVGYAGVFSWLPQTLMEFQGIGAVLAWSLFASAVAYHATQIALFAGTARIVIPASPAVARGADGAVRTTVGNTVLLAGVWVLLEYSVPKVIPWSLADALTTSRILRQAVDVAGVHGLAFAIVVVNVAVTLGYISGAHRGQRRLAVATGATVVVAVGLYGAWRTPAAVQQTDSPTLNVAMVQGALPPVADRHNEPIFEAWETYERLTVEAASRAPSKASVPDLIVWPENTLPVYLRDDDWHRTGVERLVARLGRPLLVGALDRVADLGGELNSAYLFLPTAFTAATPATDPGLQIYHKAKLMPFGEYVPGAEWVPALRWWRTTGELRPGDGSRILRLTTDDPNGGDALVAASICVEVLHAGMFNSAVRGGANLLVNITDDSWHGDSAAPDLHLAIARMRAVETRRWLVQSSNSGISAFIDPTGEIVALLPYDHVGTLVHEVALRDDITPYVRFGDWIVALSGLIVAAQVALALRRRLRRAAHGVASSRPAHALH